MILSYNYFMFKFLLDILDKLFPKQCYFCKKCDENSIMCSYCYNSIKLNQQNKIKIVNNIKVYSASKYIDTLRKLIKGVKYHNKKTLAYYQAKIMWEYFKPICEQEQFLIIPVPIHKKRLKQRKFNHMELVANELSKMSGWNVETRLIERIKDTKPQYNLNIKEREENLKNAFSIKPEFYNGEKLLIIDDIITTGSTLAEMIKTFNQHNINNITALTTATVD